MSIKAVILGFLSEEPLTGYDLKKKFSDSDMFHWSGNNNQIYRTLVELHNDECVTIEVQQQENKPPRKIYTITEKGRAALRQWVISPPDLPQLRHALLAQLTWADHADPAAVEMMLAAYEADLQAHRAMVQEQLRRASRLPTHTMLRARIAAHWLSFYDLELEWVRSLRRDLNET